MTPELRVLWLSPWMRPLSRIYAESLQSAGVAVMLITTDRHPSSDSGRPYEVVVDSRLKTLRSWPEAARTMSRARRFKPDIVVAEIVRDPRWMLLAPGTPRLQLVHDDQPHDDLNAIPRWEKKIFQRWFEYSSKVAFSRYVAEEVGAFAVVPLTSDLEDNQVPAFVPASQRRDFVLVGYINPYKNLDVCMEAWARHTQGGGWRGDKLIMIGGGEWRGALPDHVIWRSERFAYEDVLPVISRAKASVVHYRRASQSGVQVLSMQLGVTPIVSDSGGLLEYQPPLEDAIGQDDVAGLTRAFDNLADPDTAATRGRACREHYNATYSAKTSGHALLGVLTQVAALPH